MKTSLLMLVALGLATGCGGESATPGGPADGSISADARTIDGCVVSIEICGDRIDQDCNGRDTGCGDGDGDMIDACRAGDDLSRCDCDDSDRSVRPPFGALAGAPEMCDGKDNDCNGRIDEVAACCEGCASLGEHRERADICLEDGQCDCQGSVGTAVCEEGSACCASGCVDLQTDGDNCGICGLSCTTRTSDRCVAARCQCGGEAPCEGDLICTGGTCVEP